MVSRRQRNRAGALGCVLLAAASRGCSSTPPATVAPAPSSTHSAAPAPAAEPPLDPVPMGLGALDAYLADEGGSKTPAELATALLRRAALRELAVDQALDGAPAAEDALGPMLAPVVADRLRILRDWPDFARRGEALYGLANVLLDLGRVDESDQALRALVCANHYSVTLPPTEAGRLGVSSLPQDRDEQGWGAWRNAGPSEDRQFVDPYPEDCQAAPRAGARADAIVTEAWFRLGERHRHEQRAPSGPFALNRAASAYRHAVLRTSPPLRATVLFVLATVLHAQGRHRAALEKLMELLSLDGTTAAADSAGLREEACALVARSLMVGDLEGPGAEAPCLDRFEPADEERTGVALERVADPRLVPDDLRAMADVYLALASAYLANGHGRNAIAALELTLSRFPRHPANRAIQTAVADVYAALGRLAPRGSKAQTELEAQARAALEKADRLTGTAPWPRHGRLEATEPGSVELAVTACPPFGPDVARSASGAYVLGPIKVRPTPRSEVVVELSRIGIWELGPFTAASWAVLRCAKSEKRSWSGEISLRVLGLADGSLDGRRIETTPPGAAEPLVACVADKLRDGPALPARPGEKALEMTLTFARPADGGPPLLVR